MKSFKEYIIEEKDVKGQMHFDFEGAKAARIEKERAEAADDREFDRGMYRRQLPKRPFNTFKISRKKK